MLVQVYVDDIIFGSTKKSMCTEFEDCMHKRFQMSSMGELTFFLGLQVKQQPDGIFISQDKYVADILKKFDFWSIRTATTPIESNKPLVKDEDGEDVDVHVYRSMIGSLMYLTASRPDIMFAVCACARFQVTPKASHLNAVKRIFRYLKHQPKLGLWYPRDSPFELEAFSDSDYGGASLDRKSTTGGCQFLGRRLISWQCKKQTIVANSTTEAEYVAAANCCGQVLWIQNQMMDYGFNFMNTKIHIDNESTISVIKNPVAHSRTKHIEIRFHFIRDCYEKRLIEVIKIHTDSNVADLLTKGFDVTRFNFLVSKANGLGKDFPNPFMAGSLPKTIKQSNDPPLSRGYTLGSGEDSLELKELMANCTQIVCFVRKKNREIWHNMVAYLVKSESSEGFDEIIDFLTSNHIYYALTKTLIIFVSLIEQFWETAILSTAEEGLQAISATIDGHEKLITEDSLRRHLKLYDAEGISSLSNEEIFEHLAHMGYVTSYESLTFFKGHFSPQWKFFIHAILHCLSSKKTAWDQFSSNIATTLIFEAMVKNLDSPHKFLLYPRFIQLLLNKQQRLLLPHTRNYPTPTLTSKLFSNIRRASKGYSGVVTPLFESMLVQAHNEEQQQSPSRITSTPSLSQQPTPSSPSPEPIQPTYEAEETASMPYDSPLYDVHSHGSAEGSKDLQQTKKTYSTALTKLVLRVKKLEYKLKSGKARRQEKIVLFDDEEIAEDSSKQGRKISQIDEDPTISLVQDEGISWIPQEEEVHEKPSDETEVLVQEETPTEIIKEHRSGEKGEMEISTANIQVSTASPPKVSTVVPHVYTRRSAKDKGKAIMEEPATPKKVKKRTQVQLSMDEELARKMEEEERIRFNAEQEARALQEEEEERLNLEAAWELQKQLDERQQVPTEATQSKGIDWNDPSILRYHALKNRHVSIAQARRNMITYLKNQEGYKESYFKKMSYDDIRPIFERVWDHVNTFIPIGFKVEKDSSKPIKRETSKTIEKEKVKEENVNPESVLIEKKAIGIRIKTLTRRRASDKQGQGSSKRQKKEKETANYEEEKDELRMWLTVVPDEEEFVDPEILHTKFPIVDWESQSLGNIHVYKIIRADGNTSYHKTFDSMLNFFDKHDLEVLHRLVMERFQDNTPEGYNLMLWGDLKILVDPEQDDDIWKNQNQWKIISWKLYETCEVHTLMVDGTLMTIHMFVEKKYPLSKETLQKMLNWKLEA
ncbi:putative ribonuclease H-like domain-containing protein [Tanacetum coccineum]